MDFFEKAYQERPPWDIGRPQQEIVRLEKTGQITGTVLDVGCGTGDNALFLASCGHEVVGLDSVERAIEAARRKADNFMTTACHEEKSCFFVKSAGNSILSSIPVCSIPSLILNVSCLSGTCTRYSCREEAILCSRSATWSRQGTVPDGSRNRRYEIHFQMDGKSTRSGLQSLRAAQGRKDHGRGSRRLLVCDTMIYTVERRSSGSRNIGNYT